MSTPVATWNPARGAWETGQTSIICGHSMLLSQTFPISGSMRNGQVFEQPMSEPRTADSGSSYLPTPATSDTNGPGRHGTGGLDLRTAVDALTHL